jgi:acetyl-CoA carboxylase beta subunit
MTTPAKKLGIWMDHSMANLMEFTTEPIQTKTIHSDTSQHGKNSDFGKNENLMHNKEQHRQSEYYKKLGEEIKNYGEVILFGPTNAKAQLLNLLDEDQHFKKIKIEVQQTDKMTENQQHAFVKEHFSKR